MPIDFGTQKKLLARKNILLIVGKYPTRKTVLTNLLKHQDIKLYIIGNTPSQKDSSDNMQLIKNLGIEDRIVFTGVVSTEKMPQMLKDAEMLALARPDNLQAKYGFPTKLGEYLLTENPVVVTSVGDIPLFLQDGVSAIVSEPSNVEMFARKLLWVLDNPKEASKIGKAGALVALNSFNSEVETKKIVNILFHK